VAPYAEAIFLMRFKYGQDPKYGEQSDRREHGLMPPEHIRLNAVTQIMEWRRRVKMFDAAEVIQAVWRSPYLKVKRLILKNKRKRCALFIASVAFRALYNPRFKLCRKRMARKAAEHSMAL
jgi:hypothetical protein